MIKDTSFARASAAHITFRLAAASVIALVPASASLADPGLPDVRAHQHYLVTPTGDRVPIGPNLCANPDLQDAFNQFHFNIHGSLTSPTTSIPTLGPQHGAPGLDDDQGGELGISGCPVG